MYKKILWICGCNSLNESGMLEYNKEILEKNKVTDILDFFHFYKGSINRGYYDKIIYDDSYNACRTSNKVRTSFYNDFIKEYEGENIELFNEYLSKSLLTSCLK